jgi:hypothetical protein
MTGLVPCNRLFFYREKGGGTDGSRKPRPLWRHRLPTIAFFGASFNHRENEKKKKKQNKKMRARSLFSSSFHVVGQVSIGKMSIFSLLLLLFSMDGGKKMKISREICR